MKMIKNFGVLVVAIFFVITISGCEEKPKGAKEQYELAQKYENGDGVDKDINKAQHWYLKSASQGYADAQYKYALYGQESADITEKYDSIIKWYTKATEQGHAGAQNGLA